MADRYFSRATAEAVLGGDYINAALAEPGRDFDILSELATAHVQSLRRGAGLSAPTSTDGAGIEVIMQLAALAAMVELLSIAPGSTVPLPENWETNPAKVALNGIATGETQTVEDPSALGAVGGFGFNLSAANARKTSTSEMDLY